MAGLDLTGQVGGGLNQYQDGATPSLRMGRSGEGMFSELHGRYYEITKRGAVYCATTPAVGVTAGATNVSPLAANTGVPLIGLYNPLGSSVDLSILKAWVQSISGTPGGAVVWNVIPAPANITAAGSQGLNAYTFITGGQAKVFANAAITGSPLATVYRPLAGITAVASGAGQGGGLEEMAGDLIIRPGQFAGLAVAAAGTTWVLTAGVEWAEYPV